MNILMGLIPAIVWGFMPLALNKFSRGNSFRQLLGVVAGITVLSGIITLILQPAQLSPAGFWLCFFSGFGWPVGMFGQFEGYSRIGVAKTFPLSTGLQIAGNALLGWLVLHEWQGSREIIAGLAGIVIILCGILLCNIPLSGEKKSRDQEQKTSENGAKKTGAAGAVLLIIFTTVGYYLYSLLPKMMADGDGTPESQSFPQALGMLASGILIAFLVGHEKLRKENVKDYAMNTAVGLLYGVASFTYLISIRMNGMVRGFLLSQLNMIIATLSGIYILHEKQEVSRLQIYIGLGAILGGCILIEVM